MVLTFFFLNNFLFPWNLWGWNMMYVLFYQMFFFGFSSQSFALVNTYYHNLLMWGLLLYSFIPACMCLVPVTKCVEMCVKKINCGDDYIIWSKQLVLKSVDIFYRSIHIKSICFIWLTLIFLYDINFIVDT